MRVGQKYRVPRSVILDIVRQACGTDLTRPATEAELAAAVCELERLKRDGLPGGAAEPDAGRATVVM